jgi:hypothetical protein
MGFPILKNWSVKRSGAAMTLMSTAEDGQQLRLTVFDIHRNHSTGGKTIATTADGKSYELL